MYKKGDYVFILKYPNFMCVDDFRSGTVGDSPLNCVGEVENAYKSGVAVFIRKPENWWYYRPESLRPATPEEILAYKLTQ